MTAREGLGRAKDDKKPVATLTMVIEYDEVPDFADLADVVESGRSLGDVVRADLVVRRAFTRSLL